MKVSWLVRLIFFGVVVYGLGIVSLAEDPRTITVQPGESIQAAIDSASEGDTISILPGTYVENIVILGKSGITLTGSGAGVTIIKASEGEGPGILIEKASNITVSNLTIQNAETEKRRYGGEYYPPSGIMVKNADRILIQGCTVQQNRSEGVRIIGSHDISLINNTITKNGRSKEDEYRYNPDGVFIDFSNDVTLTGNIISENLLSGVYLYASDSNIIQNNMIANNSGIGVETHFSMGGEPNVIQGNTIRGNAYGVMLFSHAIVRGNIIEENGGGVNQRVYRVSVKIVNNTIRNNYGCGIRIIDPEYVQSCTGNTVYGNMPNYCDEAGKVCK